MDLSRVISSASTFSSVESYSSITVPVETFCVRALFSSRKALTFSEVLDVLCISFTIGMLTSIEIDSAMGVGVILSSFKVSDHSSGVLEARLINAVISTAKIGSQVDRGLLTSSSTLSADCTDTAVPIGSKFFVTPVSSSCCRSTCNEECGCE